VIINKLSLYGLVVSIFSIIAGAIVRATGSGDGCGSSWPTCNGEIIPKLNTSSELIEFSHRSISGILLIITLIIFVKSFSTKVPNLQKRIIWFLTFFVLLEALIGAVIVVYEWVGLNSSSPRIIAVPIHLVNTFGLLGTYTLLFQLTKNSKTSLINFFDRGFKIGLFLFLLSGATGSIAALADTIFPSESFITGLAEDFDSKSQILTRLRILHPLFASVLSAFLYSEANRLQSEYKLITKNIKLLILLGVLLGVLNVVLNIILPLSILHLLIADFLWIVYIYKSAEKIT
jgi:heme A synthase